LIVMPGYWFMYNLYALARNSGKYETRDKRVDKTQHLEYDFLAPDSVNEMFTALDIMKKASTKTKKKKDEIVVEGMENSSRKVVLVKAAEAIQIFKEQIVYYGISELIGFIERNRINSFEELVKRIGKFNRKEWVNMGGQLIPKPDVDELIKGIHNGKISDWSQVHDFYKDQGILYASQKLQHAMASLFEITGLTPSKFTKKVFRQLVQQAIATREWMVENIFESRAKDYQSEFRKMVYDSEKEMEKVIGKLKDNSFILQQQEELKAFKNRVEVIAKKISI